MQNAIKDIRKSRLSTRGIETNLTEENMATKKAETMKIIEREFGENTAVVDVESGLMDVDTTGFDEEENRAPSEIQNKTQAESNMPRPTELGQHPSESGSRQSENVDDDGSEDSGRTNETKRRLQFQKQPAVSLVALLFTPVKYYTESVDHTK